MLQVIGRNRERTATINVTADVHTQIMAAIDAGKLVLYDTEEKKIFVVKDWAEA